MDLHFETLKSIFSNIYRDLAPLSSDLKFDNSLRALTAQHLLHLGDLSKFTQKLQEEEKKGSKVDDCWNFYTRAKTVYPFEGKIYN